MENTLEINDLMNTIIEEVIHSQEIKTVFVGNTMSTIHKSSRKKQKNKPAIKPPSNRVITKEKKWIEYIEENDKDLQSQTQLLNDIENPSPKQQIIIREIKNKIRGYKQQDIEKQKYDEQQFVSLEFVIELLQKNPSCFYCKGPTRILYEQSRDPKQWTLERIDNAIGHNCENVKICCLSCNIKRRTMYHEKYLFTKQLILKKDK